ncbi:MAG: copper amine oxidase N-terminal domain-containing protein, partial [bacterium]|nr:copper amine oxidase N-terminal domain-containing protein [bacterium]
MSRRASRLLALILCVSLVVATVPIAASATTSIKVLVDNVPIAMDVAPVIISGRTLVPLRAIFEALGATVHWDEANKKITGIKGGLNITLQVGSQLAIVNGALVILDVPPTIVGGRTMVPARFIAESLGATVNWNEPAKSVEIISPILVSSISLAPSTLAFNLGDPAVQLQV